MIPPASKELSPCITATEACVPYGLCSAAREATTMRNLCTATREEPPLAVTRESPCAAMKTQHSQKKRIPGLCLKKLCPHKNLCTNVHSSIIYNRQKVCFHFWDTQMSIHWGITRDLPNPGIESGSPTVQAVSLPSVPPGSPRNPHIIPYTKINSDGSKT